jgi:two-component system, LytTR family, sensor kinase
MNRAKDGIVKSVRPRRRRRVVFSVNRPTFSVKRGARPSHARRVWRVRRNTAIVRVMQPRRLDRLVPRWESPGGGALIGCALLAAVFTAQLMIYGRWTTAEATELSLLSVIPAMALSWPVWMLSGRSPWRELPELRSLVVHAASAAVFAIILVSVSVGLAMLLGTQAMRQVLVSSMGLAALTGVGLYGLVAGAAFAIRSRASARVEEVARARAEAALADVRLSVLTARLNPHFLFNSLHSISALLHVDPARADEALERLGGLLRASIAGAGSPLASLDDEIEFASAFLDLERLRLGDHLRSIIEVDSDAHDSVVPRFLLQPLVENAVRHGVERRAGAGLIEVRARATDGVLVVEVADDGIGCGTIDWDGPGVGLVGLRRRLSLMYGPTATVSAMARPNGGCSVSVHIPLAE